MAGYNNMGLTASQIKEMQRYYGTSADGLWGSNSTSAAGGMNASDAWKKYSASKGTSSGTSYGYSGYNNGGLSSDQVKQMQNYYGTSADGMWGKNSTAAAGGLTAQQAWQQYQQSVSQPTYNTSGYSNAYLSKLNSIASQLASMDYDDWTKGSQYQSLADRYGQNGKLSMQDVLGQIASRTGGLASSYATTAAQQQYNQYMAQLEEVARQMYSSERDDLMDTASLYRSMANDEYDRYRDTVEDYNAQLAAAQKAAASTTNNYNYQFAAGTGPAIENAGNRVKATGSGVSSFSDVMRTIKGRMAGGDVQGASQMVESVWERLSDKQKQDIKKLGFSVKDED